MYKSAAREGTRGEITGLPETAERRRTFIMAYTFEARSMTHTYTRYLRVASRTEA